MHRISHLGWITVGLISLGFFVGLLRSEGQGVPFATPIVTRSVYSVPPASQLAVTLTLSEAPLSSVSPRLLTNNPLVFLANVGRLAEIVNQQADLIATLQAPPYNAQVIERQSVAENTITILIAPQLVPALSTLPAVIAVNYGNSTLDNPNQPPNTRPERSFTPNPNAPLGTRVAPPVQPGYDVERAR